jgi:uncharacterized membrane protein
MGIFVFAFLVLFLMGLVETLGERIAEHFARTERERAERLAKKRNKP